MKVLFVALLCVASGFAASPKQAREEGPPCPIDDPLHSPGPDPMNITLHPLFEIHQGGSRGNLDAVGLSTFWYEYTINLVALTINFQIKLGEVVVTADSYSVEGYLDARPLREVTMPSGNFTGSGPARIAASNVDLVASATLFINIIGNRITVRLLSVTSLTFDMINLDLSSGWVIGGRTVDWPTFNANFKANFETDFAQFKPELTEKVRLAANNIIERYTLQEFLDLIGGGGEPCPTKAPKF